MKPPLCVVDKWAGGSLTRRPKGPFAVSWPRQLGESKVITITHDIATAAIFFLVFTLITHLKIPIQRYEDVVMGLTLAQEMNYRVL